MPAINDTKHKLTDKEIVTSVDSDDTIFVNIDGALKQIAIKDALQVEGGIVARVTAVEEEVDELNSNLNHVLIMEYDASHTITDLANFIFNNNLIPSGGTFRGVLHHGTVWRYEGYSLNTAEGYCGSVHMEQYINNYPISYTFSVYKGVLYGGNSNLAFHKGDTYKYTGTLYVDGLSTSDSGKFRASIYLPKEVGSDVSSISINGTVTWLRTIGENINSSDSTLQVDTYINNVVNFFIVNDEIGVLKHYTAPINNLTITFN